MGSIKILCIHGIGGKDNPNEQQQWQTSWEKAIKEHTSKEIEVTFSEFDSFFDSQKATLKDYLFFLRNAIFGRERPEKGLFPDLKDDFIDMIVEFFRYEGVREELRRLLKKDIEKTHCNIIFAHSLGSLMCYDFFREEFQNDLFKNITLITAGSQLGHKNLPDFKPIQALNIKHWYNLNNQRDGVFASRKIGSSKNNCEDIPLKFGFRFGNAHDGERYIKEGAILWKKVLDNY
ncbi:MULTISPECIES: hypothetical protein [unclassified Chryseobacterium]|uniref:hypothetical protein n=1 Tax=Chryseobacterium sp. R2A-55 TaxID=2744445 RepID=UPI001F20377C|nr:hypothetical protein [Chryseobacterium sp. R2A-55]